MSENQQQGQESRSSAESREAAASTRSEQNSQSQQTQQRDNEPKIPKHRLDEESRKRREAEQKLARIEQEREQAQEQQAQEQGQYQKLAEQRQKRLEKVEAELKQVKASWTEERRRNTWNTAAQGIVKGNAINDAFTFLDEADLSALDEGDTEGYRKLAQNLVEVRDYLGAEGVRGAGSGGSERPVLGHAGSPNGKQRQSGGREVLFHNPAKRRRPWK